MLVDSLLRSVNNVGKKKLFEVDLRRWYHQSGRARPNLHHQRIRLQGYHQQIYDKTEVCVLLTLENNLGEITRTKRYMGLSVHTKNLRDFEGFHSRPLRLLYFGGTAEQSLSRRK